jgi:CTP synthase
MTLHKQDIDKRILAKLNLPAKRPNLRHWQNFLDTLNTPTKKTTTIAIIGKYFGSGDYQLRDSYAALFDAIDHASWHTGVKVTTQWLDAEQIEREGTSVIGHPDGIIVPIGWGERGSEGMIAAATYAREQRIPYLGLCYGMQLACVAFARSVLGLKNANTTEVAPDTTYPVIYLIPSQKALLERRAYGGTMRLGGWDALVKKGTKAFELYDGAHAFIDKSKGLTSERHRHRYEFNNAYAKDFEAAGLVISARSANEGLVEIIEIPDHPFYIGTQGHPEYKSRPLQPHPIFLGFVEAAAKQT